jgi:hypothetical protein
MPNPLKTLQTLCNKGWIEQETSRGKEKVAQLSKKTFCYDTPAGDQLDLCYFELEKKLRFRIYSPKDKDVRWFEIDIEEQLGQLVQELARTQDDIAFSNYFSFYLSMQSVCEISILAWEQWEK